jgi:Domain of unknown function DUF29
MSDSSLYEEDILLWSEQQAAVIRRLGQTRRDVPNELDIENVAEEIESVGRSELAAVKSHIRLIFLHLIKLVVNAGSDASSHWRDEVVAFHSDIIERYAPSMRQRIDIDQLWRSARAQSLLAHEGAQKDLVADLPEGCVFFLDDLLAEQIDIFGLIDRLQQARSQG